jgi:glycosyltransferase involved in cell wall biosynthesis
VTAPVRVLHVAGPVNARIAVDATAVSPAGKGIGRVARGAVEALARRGQDVVALVREGVVLEARTEVVRPRPAVAWEQLGLARAARRFDAVLTFTERLPLVSGGRFLVWLFELPTHRIEQNRRAGAGLYQRGSDLVTLALWRRSLRRAAAVLTGSAATAKELEEAVPGLPRVRVVHPGLDPGFGPGPGREGRYVLHLGSADPRDNTQTVLEAFALARQRLRQPARLVVAGSRGEPRDGVEWAGRVSDEELVALYRGAAAYLDATLYEGFGYQPLEAMACGAPVVASSASSIPEVVGEAGLLCDPRDPDGLAEALVRVLEEPGLGDDLRRRGLERAAAFTWERTADRLLAALDEVLA